MRLLLRLLVTGCALLGAQLHAGNLKVNLAPSAAVSAGAKWQVDGGSWRNSGSTAKKLSNTTHVVTFKTVTGWIAPAPVTVAIVSGTKTISATYVQAGALTVNLTPTSGQWRIDGGDWLSSAAVASNLTPGLHTINYAPLADHSSPADESVTLSPGESLSLSRNYVQLAQVSIALTPAAGQWRVDGGSWQTAGATLAVLPGDHLIDYAGLTDFDAPASEPITLTAGGVFNASRAYTSQKPTLQINLSPASGQWRLDHGAWLPSGAQLTELSVGEHAIDYTELGGIYDPLPAETIALTLRENAVLDRSYPLKPPAALTVMLDPASAQWRVDGGDWQPSGTTIADLAYDAPHTIDYATAAGFITPPSDQVTLASGESRTLAIAYTQLASVSVTLDPASALWQIDGGSWNPSGATVADLVPGAHTLAFGPLAGFATPPAEPVTLTAGQSLSLARVYAPLPASLTVNLSETTGSWRLDGGAWRTSGTTLGDISAGNHSLSFGAVFGFEAPLDETITLAPGESRELSRDYVARPGSVSVTLDPTTAQWTIHPAEEPAGPLLGSSGIVNVPAGNYVIEYEALADHLAPATEAIVVSPGATIELTRSYTYDPAFAIVHSFVDSGAQAQFLRGSDGRFYGVTAFGGPRGSGTVFRLEADGTGHTVLYAFASGAGDGLGPMALTEGIDGVLYGTTQNGGVGTNNGTVFRINRDGTGYAVLRSFVDPFEGSSPTHLIEGSEGVLYGVTALGLGNQPRIFRLNHDGSGFAVLAVLPASSNPQGLTETEDGALIGTTRNGGSAAVGTIFRLTKSGAGFSTYKNFAGSIDGASPSARLVSGNDGWLYGTTRNGGANNRGLVFRIAVSGQPYQVLYHFTGGAADGSTPMSPLNFSSDGGLIGNTFAGGAANRGALFRLDRKGGGYTVLKLFSGDVLEGGLPSTRPWELDDGRILAATTYAGSGSYGALVRHAPGTGITETLLSWGAPEGSSVIGSVTPTNQGVLFGTTYGGGLRGYGTLYSVNADGSGFNILHHFDGGTTGKYPSAPLTVGSDGSIYGTVYSGGINSAGLLFKIAPENGAFSVVRNFGPAGAGTGPECVIEASDGFLYGTTSGGGSANAGTIFRTNHDGSVFVVLYDFPGGTAGAQWPGRGLIQGADQRLYGTTVAGGPAGLGTVFAINTAGTDFVLLHDFIGGTTDGANPWAGLHQGSDGTLYGTTTKGGATTFGTVFKLNPDGSSYSVLKSFAGGPDDGTNPSYSGVVERNGWLYGTTAAGGTFTDGVLFALRTDGSSYEVLVNFGAGAEDSAVPASSVIVTNDGTLLGTTAYGANGGTIFRYRIE